MEQRESVPPAAGVDGSRRSLFQAGILGLGAAIAAALGLPALGYLLTPPKPRQQDSWTEIGELIEFIRSAQRGFIK